MSWDCPCGVSFGGAHWCEWMQQQHARRVERLLVLLLYNLVGPEDRGEADELAAIIARDAPDYLDDRDLPPGN